MADLIANLDWFKDDGVFLPMLNDEGRNHFYKNALDRIAKDKVIADVGAGTGLLSILAAAAGAEKIYAIERDRDRYEYMTTLIERSGFKDRIQPVHADFLHTDIRADYYVSETINTQIFGENILSLAAHATRHGGEFIPGSFEITPVMYEHHPIFILDQSQPDAYDFDPRIPVDDNFYAQLRQDIARRHPIETTLYRANQLNKLFQLLPRFHDVKLNRLWQGAPLVIDLDQSINEDSISIEIDTCQIPCVDKDWYLVLFWQARFHDITMHSNDVWFGNVSKCLMKNERRQQHIKIQWQSCINDWTVFF